MASAARKKRTLDRRLKELEKEAEKVRSDIKVLSRTLKRSDDAVPWDRLKTAAPAPAPEPEEGPSLELPVEEVAEQALPEPEPEHSEHDLFHPPPRERHAPKLMPEPIQPASESWAAAYNRSRRETGAEQPRGKVAFDNRFASYLTSGSFSSARPLKHERAVLRNRAIGMVIVVIVFGYIVFKLVVSFLGSIL